MTAGSIKIAGLPDLQLLRLVQRQPHHEVRIDLDLISRPVDGLVSQKQRMAGVLVCRCLNLVSTARRQVDQRLSDLVDLTSIPSRSR